MDSFFRIFVAFREKIRLDKFQVLDRRLVIVDDDVIDASERGEIHVAQILRYERAEVRLVDVRIGCQARDEDIRMILRRYAILLFVHISIMMAMAMTFGGDSIRYFQPISFMTLPVLALGANIALRSVRKDQAIAGGQRSETLRPDLSALAQPAFTVS